jgi:hypothetical protein
MFQVSGNPVEETTDLRKKREEYTMDIRQKDRESFFKAKREANVLIFSYIYIQYSATHSINRTRCP